jgi:ferrous iron transport protein B
VLFLLYTLGVGFAIVSALLLRRVFIKSADVPFVMELPPYRIPTHRSILRHVWFRTSLYLRKIGGVILLASIIIWILSNFPRDAGNTGISKSEIQSNSYMGMIGKGIEPVMKPLGFDWRLSVSLLSGIAAKEVVVSTLGILYLTDSKPFHNSLVEKLQTHESAPGKRGITPVIAFTFMMFILTYFPCVGVIAAIKRESGSWKWAAFTVFYTTTVAWVISFVVFQTGSLLFT